MLGGAGPITKRTVRRFRWQRLLAPGAGSFIILLITVGAGPLPRPRDAAGAGELVVDGGGAETVLGLVNILITVDDALRVQRVREHGPRVGLFITGRRSIHETHGRF